MLLPCPDSEKQYELRLEHDLRSWLVEMDLLNCTTNSFIFTFLYIFFNASQPIQCIFNRDLLPGMKLHTRRFSIQRTSIDECKLEVIWIWYQCKLVQGRVELLRIFSLWWWNLCFDGVDGVLVGTGCFFWILDSYRPDHKTAFRF